MTRRKRVRLRVRRNERRRYYGVSHLLRNPDGTVSGTFKGIRMRPERFRGCIHCGEPDINCEVFMYSSISNPSLSRYEQTRWCGTCRWEDRGERYVAYPSPGEYPKRTPREQSDFVWLELGAPTQLALPESPPRTSMGNASAGLPSGPPSTSAKARLPEK